MDLMAARRRLMANAQKNYLLGAEWIYGYYLTPYGVPDANDSGKYTETFIPVISGKVYILKGTAISTRLYDRIHAYNVSKEWIKQIAALDWPVGKFSSTITIPENCSFIRISTENTTEIQMYVV